MKKLVRKLFISSLAMVFALVAVGTTTFAWFTTSNVATVDTVTFEVKGNESILVSIDGKEFSTDLTAIDLYKAINHVAATNTLVETTKTETVLTTNGEEAMTIDSVAENIEGYVLDAVTSEWFSTVDEETDEKVAFAAGSTAMIAGAKPVPTFYAFDAKANTSKEVVANNKMYYAFNIYVQNASSKPVALSIDFDFSQLTDQLASFVLAANAATDGNAGTTVNLSLLDALRFGYVHDGYAKGTANADATKVPTGTTYYKLNDKNEYVAYPEVEEENNPTLSIEDYKAGNYYVKGYAVSDLYGPKSTLINTDTAQGGDHKTNGTAYPELDYVHNIYKKNSTYNTAWEHEVYNSANGTTWDEDQTYYILNGTVYEEVDDPQEGSLNTYYIKGASESYIDFAMANDGIDVLPTVTSYTSEEDKYAVPATELGTLGESVNTLAVNETRCYTFYLWCEGWDADCFDAILGQQFNLDIKFQIKSDFTTPSV